MNTKNLLASRPQVFLRPTPYFYYIAVRNISPYSGFVSSNSPYGLDLARAARYSGLFFLLATKGGSGGGRCRLLTGFDGPASLQAGIGAGVAVIAGEEAARLELFAQQENGEQGGETG
ncbi:hypothetical protein [Collimonas humicola]|uniref:hypothetical protein n=1 Tax=Collimonas humicola TaxID=2825886 RepID=UPI001B8D2900|nr:hypothetical protein [Collimonas humicola]